jgi:hypothetical protein
MNKESTLHATNVTFNVRKLTKKMLKYAKIALTSHEAEIW